MPDMTTVTNIVAAIIAAGDERTSLIQRVSHLEAQLARFETWETEKHRYELKQLATSGAAFAYSIKQDAQGSEPFHALCPTCYGKRMKSILLFARHAAFGGVEQILKCPVCRTEVHAAGWPPATIDAPG